MYTPKVGDKITHKELTDYYVICLVIGDIVGYTRSGTDQVYLTNNVNKTFHGYIFPKTKWLPKKGETCYYPLLDCSHGYGMTEGVGELKYVDDPMGIVRQNYLLDNGLFFKTKEEALACRAKMMEAIK